MSRLDTFASEAHDPFEQWREGPVEPAATSPWRTVIEEINQEVAGRRDEIATIGSINWLRHAMEQKRANPNVVRNIIYRDKGRLHDKRALYLVLQELRAALGLGPITDPELTYLGSAYAEAELEVSQVLGRQQRRAYRAMVGGIRAGGLPRLLVLGKPGSGKTMLADYIQRALQQADDAPSVARFDFAESDLNSSFVRFAVELGVDPGVVESRLVRIGTASAFAVQADAQTEAVRAIIEHLRRRDEPRVILLHLAQGLTEPGRLGAAPLRLNTPEVPRVSAAEWLWATLIGQLAALPGTALFISTAALPTAAHGVTGTGGWFDGQLTLTAPTAAEARHFVQAHAAQLDEKAQAEIVERAGRSYEALRTLSLLAMVRRPSGADSDDHEAIARLAAAVDPGSEARLRSFLVALTTLSSVESTRLGQDELLALAGSKSRKLSSVELAFLDPLPGRPGRYRAFSRRFVRELNARLGSHDPEALRRSHAAAARALRSTAEAEPAAEAADHYLKHTLAARQFDELLAWLTTHPVSYAVLDRIWAAAREHLEAGERFEDLALEVARQFVRLGAAEHVEAVRAFEQLAESTRPEVRAWTAVLRAQTEVAAGRFERARVLLDIAPESTDAVLEAERALANAGVLRWRAELEAAADLVATAGAALAKTTANNQAAAALAAKTAVWSGLIAKDRGDLDVAIRALWTESREDDLVEARLSFQRGDVALQLGLFSLAGQELDKALAAAERSGALPGERARYLARRGSLARLRGDLAGARDLFGTATTVLEDRDAAALDLAYARAKVDDEATYTALAGGDFESAIVAGTTAIATYRDYQRRRDVDAGFRIARASLRLAVAYAFRGLGLPYRRPWPARSVAAGAVGRSAEIVPDLAHAAASLNALVEEFTLSRPGFPNGSSAARGLLREARLVLSYITSDASLALDLATTAANEARFAYQRAEAHTSRAGALLGSDDPAGALTALDVAKAHLEESLQVVARVVTAARTETGDLGLVAQLATYKVAALLAVGDQAAAAAALSEALEDERLAPFHEGLLRAFGEIADVYGQAWRRHRGLRSLLGINGTGPSTPARLPDALVAAWRERASEKRLAEPA